MLVFVPLGVYISILKPNWAFGRKIIPPLLLSVLLEVLQFIFAIGASDITDVIGNTLGGIIGIGLFILLMKMFKKNVINIINIIGFMIELIAVTMLCILYVNA